ncbi:hypothetical protein [Nocardia blacklockiae]|uniref:hypothetical protein n=1 Tax=Nocardia blacklockiae TaxID=480036 RepID=UPI001892F3D9|nr:hypothetical protein [Nocardia blacklockiae]MBF6170723.1 hypothetical protein [Nocardia blacklockiae]
MSGVGERSTEAGGWQAVWRLDRHRIRMMAVRRVGGGEVLLSVGVGEVAPDLAQVREWFPELSGLWDAVRHEYWAGFIAAQREPRAGAIGEMAPGAVRKPTASISANEQMAGEPVAEQIAADQARGLIAPGAVSEAAACGANRATPGPARIYALTVRAARAGYLLVHGPAAPHDWILLDAEDGVPLYAAANLELIERWLAR